MICLRMSQIHRCPPSHHEMVFLPHDIRDLGSMVIGFSVLTLLEQPEKLSKIKKSFLF